MSLLGFLLAASLSAGNVEFEQASVCAAAEIALDQLKSEISDKGLTTNYLERVMSEDPASYRTCAEAEPRCKELYRAELDRVYRVKAEGIVHELGVKRETTNALDATFLDEAVARHFAHAFKTDRTAACKAQAETIALKVKPDEVDLETKGDDAARAWLTDRIIHAKGIVVFEENRQYISEKIVDPILADAREERKRQRDYLMTAHCNAYAPENLAKEIETKLRNTVAERKAKCENPLRAWNVFPATLRASLTNAVERRLLNIVAKEMDDVPFSIDTNAVRETIAANPSAHREKAASEKIFRKLYAKDLIARAIIRAEQAAPLPEREAFSAFVRAREEADVLRKAATTQLNRDTMPKWRAIRAEIARTEASRLWPTLVDRTWFPNADLADRMAARSDYSEAVRNWRDTPELTAFANADALALQESSQTADKSVSDAFDVARNAVAAQHAIIGKVQSSVLNAAKDLSLADVIKMLTKAVEKEWDETRLATLWKKDRQPKNAEDQHKELFPSVKREIELVARQILEETVKAEEMKLEAKPIETLPEHEEEKPKEEICTIEFELTGGDVTVRAKRGDALVTERKAKATAKGFENAVREVGAVVGREVFKLK